MRYTMPDSGKTITIPEDFLERTMKAYEVPRGKAIEMFLVDEGLIKDETVDALTAKAKAAGTGAKNTSDKPKRKPPVRKPDEVKRAIVAALAEFIGEQPGVVETDVTNVERQIAFSLGGEKYELTLVKKRKPKE